MDGCLKMKGMGKLSFTIEHHIEGITELESHHFETTIGTSDLGKNHQWMLKPLGAICQGMIYFT